MTTTTTCDHCGKPISDENEHIRVRVVDRYLPKMSDLKTEKLPTLRVELDLHRECYVEHVLPAISAVRS